MLEYFRNKPMKLQTKLMISNERFILSKSYQIILRTHPEWLSIYHSLSHPIFFHGFPGRDLVTSSILANLLDCYLQMGPSTQVQPGTNLHHGSIGVKSSICWLVDFCSLKSSIGSPKSWKSCLAMLINKGGIINYQLPVASWRSWDLESQEYPAGSIIE